MVRKGCDAFCALEQRCISTLDQIKGKAPLLIVATRVRSQGILRAASAHSLEASGPIGRLRDSFP